MAKAPAGMTGGLSITDMRELMKATDEIDTLAEKTANQLKVLTDSGLLVLSTGSSRDAMVTTTLCGRCWS